MSIYGNELAITNETIMIDHEVEQFNRITESFFLDSEYVTEGFGDKAKELWEKFKKWLKEIKDKIVSALKKFRNMIKEKWDKIFKKKKEIENKKEEIKEKDNKTSYKFKDYSKVIMGTDVNLDKYSTYLTDTIEKGIDRYENTNGKQIDNLVPIYVKKELKNAFVSKCLCSMDELNDDGSLPAEYANKYAEEVETTANISDIESEYFSLDRKYFDDDKRIIEKLTKSFDQVQKRVNQLIQNADMNMIGKDLIKYSKVLSIITGSFMKNRTQLFRMQNGYLNAYGKILGAE